ncbi:MAG: NAD-dependent epimerase/dehydratase family protein [Pseudohongiellaceae bacterium]
MRYVVTGGCGFIGSHVVEMLLSKGKQVAVIDKITTRRATDQALFGGEVQHFYMDISDPHLMEKALLPGDTVIHLAAQSHVDVSFKNPVQTTVSNVVGIHSLLAACVKKQVKKVIVMSTDEVYGSAEHLVDARQLDPANPYSASKAAADMIASAYQKMHPEMPITILRSNNIAGPGQFINNIIPRFSVLGLLNRKFTLHGDGSARRRYLWVKDAALAIYLLAEKANKNRIYHIGQEEPFSNLQIAEKIGAYLGLKDYLSFEKDRLINDTIYPAESTAMQRDFNWQPTRSLDDFLPETIEWYRTHLDDFRDLV